MRICAHSVAVAEMCKKLPEFVEKLRKSKNAQYQPCSSHKPQCQKGRGRKGSECPHKRKTSTMTYRHDWITLYYVIFKMNIQQMYHYYILNHPLDTWSTIISTSSYIPTCLLPFSSSTTLAESVFRLLFFRLSSEFIPTAVSIHLMQDWREY